MKMIWAVVRSDKIEQIARQLNKIGVSGCTVYPVRGYGEHWHLYEPLIHGGHHKLEVILEDEQVEKVVKEISKSGSTGRAGDGMLSVFDLQSVVSLKGSTGTEIKDHGTL
jgi:nitrogen regulatory protein P-II 1